MKAVGLLKYLPVEHPEAFLDVELPRPQPQGRDLLVAVKAVAVNPVDYKTRAPKERVEASPRVLGWDAAGVVEAVGPQASLFKPGDAVYYAGDITRPGCNSEFHCVDERIAGAKPASLSFAQAAALPLTAITAWEGLFDRLHVSPDGAHRGQRVLIVGGAGGVGSLAIQIARQVAGLEVIATASRPETVAWCRDLGAHHVVDHNGDLPAQLKALGIAGVHNALCCNDLDRHFPALVEAVLPHATICSIVENKQPLDFRPLRTKSGSYAIEYMFTRPMYQTPDMIEQHRLLTRVAGLIDADVLRTTLNEVLGRIDAATLRRAHALLESGRAIGKLVLEGF